MNEAENTFDLTEQIANKETAQLEIVSTINKLYAEAEAVAKMSKDYAQKAIEIALECGRLLIEQKKQVGHGNWETWCKDNLSFRLSTAKKYMGLYRKTLELSKTEDGVESNRHLGGVLRSKAKNLKEAYIATGILPEPPKADTSGAKRMPNHTKWIDGFILWYDKIKTTNPVEQWSNAERSVVINDLKRLMRIHDELEDLQK